MAYAVNFLYSPIAPRCVVAAVMFNDSVKNLLTLSRHLATTICFIESIFSPLCAFAYTDSAILIFLLYFSNKFVVVRLNYLFYYKLSTPFIIKPVIYISLYSSHYVINPYNSIKSYKGCHALQNFFLIPTLLSYSYLYLYK